MNFVNFVEVNKCSLPILGILSERSEIMFWKRFVELCHEQNTTPTALVKQARISVGSVTKWKNGSVPNDSTILTLAQHMKVAPDYLSGKSPFKRQTDEEYELAEYLEELKTRPEMKMLFSLAKGATKEDVEQAVAIIEALKRSRNG